jgi:anti-sigma regulatory factor (Ser/Thr protein kinase)
MTRTRHDTGFETVPGPEAIADFRARVDDRISTLKWLTSDRRIDIVLLTSELLSNAFQHVDGGTVQMRTQVDRDTIRIDVRDTGSSPLPATERPAASATGGRGLWLLQALSDDYGVEQHSGGKDVWFCIHAGGLSEVRR